MSITDLIKEGTAQAVKDLYDHEVNANDVNMNVTRKEFDGDYSVVVFPYTKAAKKKPEQKRSPISLNQTQFLFKTS